MNHSYQIIVLWWNKDANDVTGNISNAWSTVFFFLNFLELFWLNNSFSWISIICILNFQLIKSNFDKHSSFVLFHEIIFFVSKLKFYLRSPISILFSKLIECSRWYNNRNFANFLSLEWLVNAVEESSIKQLHCTVYYFRFAYGPLTIIS